MNSRKKVRIIAAASVMAALVVSALGTTFVLAAPSQSSVSAGFSASAKATKVSTTSNGSVNISQLPKASAKAGATARPSLKLLSNKSLHNGSAGSKSAAPHINFAVAPNTTTSPKTPSPSTSFKGLQDSNNPAGNNGYYFEPPDQAVAASPSYVVQAVNDEVVVYNTSGVAQAGPVGADAFFGLGSNSCYGTFGEAFLSDPRLVYDPNTQRFIFAMLEIEGAPVGNTCAFTSVYHIAVSKTSNPASGGWYLYTANMNLANCTGTTTDCFADYTQLGFDSQGIYISANEFNSNGTAYDYAEVFGFNKATAESGSGLSGSGFFDLSVGGKLVDTVQPVATEAPANTPNAELFVNTFNMNGDPNGNDCFTTACTGAEVWSFSGVTGSAALTGTYVGNTKSYISPPNANEPGCTACIETIDTRITGTPVYKAGYVYAAWVTGITNYSSQFVAGVLWSKIRVRLDGNTINNSFQEEGYYYFGGSDISYSFPAIGLDADNNMFMVYERMGSTVNPELDLVARHATDRSGFFPDGGRIVKSGDQAYNNFNGACSSSNVCRWGDYEATSYDGYNTNNVWFCGEYSATGTLPNTNWGTWCGKVQYAYGQ